MQESADQAIERYLRSGDYDAGFRMWPGDNYIASAKYGEASLRKALISAVHCRTQKVTHPGAVAEMDVVAITQEKVAPMVKGLFPPHERDAIHEVLAHSVVVLSPATINEVLEQTPWLSTAWDLANLYLASVDAELLAEDAPNLVGLSEGTTCYLSANYFDATGRFDDFLVHEVAHIFHNCKRRLLGLRETRQREWLLEIDFSKRETFAYACETYSRIHEVGGGLQARQSLLAEYAQGPMPADDRVEVDEYLDILREAVAARNGWKWILDRCSPPRQSRRGGVALV
jgi:hypothetical protein